MYYDRHEHHENRMNNRRNRIRCNGCGCYDTELHMTHIGEHVFCSGKGCQQEAQARRNAQLAQKKLWMERNGFGSNVVTLNPNVKAA